MRDRVGLINKANGFHEVPFNLGEKLMLITSELSECLEADRIGKLSDINGFDMRMTELRNSINTDVVKDEQLDELKVAQFKTTFKNFVKEGVEAEIIDALIRIFDLCYLMKIDMDKLIDLILQNNALRGYKHGKKY